MFGLYLIGAFIMLVVTISLGVAEPQENQLQRFFASCMSLFIFFLLAYGAVHH